MRRPSRFALAASVVLGSCTGAPSTRPHAGDPGADARPPAPSTGPTHAPGRAVAEQVVPLLPDGITFAAVPLGRYVDVYERAGADHPAFVFGTRNWLGRTAPLLVVADRVDRSGTRWLEVQLPIRPNGRTAWVRGDDVRLVERGERIVIDLSSRTLRHFRGDELVHRLRVGIGRPETPTAVGTFFVWLRAGFDGGSGPYGVFALGLSGFSPVLTDWPGGGRMAIHGTSEPSDRGRQVSNGCIRVYNSELGGLRRVPLGTPVTIRP